MVPHADLAIVDPYFSGVYITRNFGYLVYDTLLGMDRAFHPQPEMVDSWQAIVVAAVAGSEAYSQLNTT